MDRMGEDFAEATEKEVIDRLYMCYMKACCDLGYEDHYIKQHEKGEIKGAMLKKIREGQLDYILQFSTPLLERANKLQYYAMGKDFAEAIEKELMHRIIDEN